VNSDHSTGETPSKGVSLPPGLGLSKEMLQMLSNPQTHVQSQTEKEKPRLKVVIPNKPQEVRYRRHKRKCCLRFRFMVFNATVNNISVISWLSVLLMEEIGENHRPFASH